MFLRLKNRAMTDSLRWLTKWPLMIRAAGKMRAATLLLAVMICLLFSADTFAGTFNGFNVNPTFVVGKRGRQLATGDFNGDGLPDIVVAGIGSNQVNVLLSCQAGTQRCVNGFLPAENYAVGTPEAVVTADVNGDGILDLIVASAGGNSLTVFVGKGDGTFVSGRCSAAGGLCMTGVNPTFLAVGNFKGKNKEVDVVAVNTTSNSISVFLGNGKSFSLPTTYSVGTSPTWAAVADVNGDGFQDIVVANGGSNSLTVLLGNGQGGFTVKSNPSTDAGPVSVAIADFNNDKIPDLAVANTTGNTVDILLGNGDGTFQTASAINAGSHPQTVAVGNFNNDGNMDLAVADGAGNNVTVLLGNGNGTFQPGVQYTSGAKTVAAAVVYNVHGNGQYDLLVSNADLVPGIVTIIYGKGDGTFLGGINLGTGTNPQGIVSGNFSCNGNNGLAVANAASNSVQLFLGAGNGTFTPGVTLTTDNHPVAIVTADFNQDGVPDLAVVNAISGDVTVMLGSPGCAGFNTPVNYSLGSGVVPISLATADFNGDGFPDLVIANVGNAPGTGSVITLLNNKDGTFGTPIISYAGTNPGFVAAGDFNRDGQQDVIVTNQDTGNVSVLLGSNTGSFTLTSTTCVGLTLCAGVPSAIAVGYFTGNNNLDVAVADYNDASVSILFGNGLGAFGSTHTYTVGANPLSIVAAPLQGNAMQEDLIVANSENDTVSVLRNQLNGKGGFLGPSNTTYATGESPASLAVADFNNDGQLDVATANQSSNNITVLGQNQ